MSLQELVDYIETFFTFLFEEYDLTVTYTFERPYPPHIRVGLESNKLPAKILFVHEWATSVMIGFKDANFEEDDNWFEVGRLIDFIERRPMRWTPDKASLPYERFLLENLQEKAKEFYEFSKTIFDLFCREDAEQWIKSYRAYVDNEIRQKFVEKNNPN